MTADNVTWGTENISPWVPEVLTWGRGFDEEIDGFITQWAIGRGGAFKGRDLMGGSGVIGAWL
jgi:hypothetical protein